MRLLGKCVEQKRFPAIFVDNLHPNGIPYGSDSHLILELLESGGAIHEGGEIDASSPL